LDKFRFYKGHRTSLDDLNEVQDFFEGSDHARTRDWLGTGVAFSMEFTPSTGTLMASVSPGASYNSSSNFCTNGYFLNSVFSV